MSLLHDYDKRRYFYSISANKKTSKQKTTEKLTNSALNSYVIEKNFKLVAIFYLNVEDA